MPNDPFQAAIARLALTACRQFGFVLGGGQALIAHEIVDRTTEDIDLFTDQDHAVQAAATAVEDALRTAGYDVSRVPGVEDLGALFEGFDDGMVELEVSKGEELVRLSLARLDRTQSPVVMDMGPVMHVDDCIASKVAAVAGRAQIRDFVDLAAATGLVYDPAAHRDGVRIRCGTGQ
jgi:hypothetical protein